MTNTHESSKRGHVFRPGPFHRRRAYWLNGAVLHWRVGSEEGYTPLAEIESMRLYLPEGANLSGRCVLVDKTDRVHKLCDRYWPRLTKTEWRSWGRLQRREATFRNLTCTLARRLGKENPEAVIEQGPGRTEWILSCIVGLVAMAVVIAGAILMSIYGQFPVAVIGFMALAATQLPLLWPVIRSGGPKPLDPETLHNANPPPGWADG